MDLRRAQPALQSTPIQPRQPHVIRVRALDESDVAEPAAVSDGTKELEQAPDIQWLAAHLRIGLLFCCFCCTF